MLPKRGQQWSYLDRGRTFSAAWALISLGFMAFGVYLLATRGNWVFLMLSVICLGLSGLLAWENERKNRPPIFDEEEESVPETSD